MLRTVIITGTIAFALLAVILVSGVVAEATPRFEYFEFGLTLLTLLVTLVGSY